MHLLGHVLLAQAHSGVLKSTPNTAAIASSLAKLMLTWPVSKAAMVRLLTPADQPSPVGLNCAHLLMNGYLCLHVVKRYSTGS